MTPEEMALLRRQHEPVEMDEGPACPACHYELWPCLVIQAVNGLKAAQRSLKDAREALTLADKALHRYRMSAGWEEVMQYADKGLIEAHDAVREALAAHTLGEPHVD